MAEKLILVLEDDAVILELLRQALEMEGYQAVTAVNGLEGLNRLTELQAEGRKPPDLILCDVMMPVMDGVTFCQSLAANPVYQAIPVVLLTAAATDIYMKKCRYSYVVRKPFDLDQLMAVLAILFN